MDTNELDSDGKYVKRKLEPSVERTVNPLLRNRDQSLQQALLTEGRVTTPFFDFQARFTAVDPEQLIQTVLDHIRKELEREGKTNILKQGKLHGTEIGLRMRFENTKIPAQLIESLIVRGKTGKELDLRKVVPEQHPILWIPGEDVSRSAFHTGLELLMISGDITSPEGLFVGLHESTHAQDIAQNPSLAIEMQTINANILAPTQEEIAELEKIVGRLGDNNFAEKLKSKFDPVTDTDLKKFIQNERRAWAVALRQMMELTHDQELITACKTYIHEHPLRINSDILRTRGHVK